jgi:hypothetical protein
MADGAKPRDFMRFSIPPIETVREYHENIEFFAALKNVELMREDVSGAADAVEMVFKWCEPYMRKARELFPYELWTDYWYAYMYAAFDGYTNAYPYIQTMLDNPLVCSMQIYPEVLELATRGAKSLGKQE